MAPTWTTISAAEYGQAFDRLGGSFATHPRVVALIADLAGRPVEYRGLPGPDGLVAAVPLWDDHVVATKATLDRFGLAGLFDIGDSEIILPMRADVRIDLPFQAAMLSPLHRGNIGNLAPEDLDLMLAKGLKAGERRQSKPSQTRRALEERNFVKFGGNFRPMAAFSAEEVAAIYAGLYSRRWNGPPLGAEHLTAALIALRDFLCGDILFHKSQPVAVELTYRHETPQFLFVNSVQAGHEKGLFPQHSLGSILYFHNLGLLEAEARARGKPLRYNLGWNDAAYKSVLATPMPAFRLAPMV